jgi:hypothetical protein
MQVLADQRTESAVISIDTAVAYYVRLGVFIERA